MSRPDDAEVAARLGAADPAADLQVDLDQIRTMVRDRLAVDADEPVVSGPEEGPHPVAPGPGLSLVGPSPHEVGPTPGVPAPGLASVVPMRRRWVGWAAAAAAVVVVVVGGGYVVSSLASSRSGSPVDAAPSPLEQPEGTQGGADRAPAPTGPGEPAPPAVRHIAVGLPDTAGTATVYQVAAPRVDPERLAQAWGVPGPVRRTPDGWAAGDSTRTLRITEADGLVHVDFSDTSVTGQSTDQAAARAALVSAGVDVSVLDVSTSAGVVHLNQVVAGHPTSLGWQVQMSPSGPRAITGTLGGAITSQGTQALVSPVAAVARLDDPAFASWSATMPDLTGPLLTDVAQGTIPPSVTTVAITSARLGLALDVSSGTPRLVPAYALTSEYGTNLAPALADP